MPQKEFKSNAEYQAYIAKYGKLAEDASKKVDAVVAELARVRGKIPNKLPAGYAPSASAEYEKKRKEIFTLIAQCDRLLARTKVNAQEFAKTIKTAVIR